MRQRLLFKVKIFVTLQSETDQKDYLFERYDFSVGYHHTQSLFVCFMLGNKSCINVRPQEI